MTALLACPRRLLRHAAMLGVALLGLLVLASVAEASGRREADREEAAHAERAVEAAALQLAAGDAGGAPALPVGTVETPPPSASSIRTTRGLSADDVRPRSHAAARLSARDPPLRTT